MAYITLNKNNFFNNLDIISNKCKTKDKIAIVLKDNAYGHGLLEIAQMASEYGIKKCVVQSTFEAKKVENFFEYILVLSDIPTQPSEKIRYTINDINMISAFAKKSKVELKVDTGMHRNGIAIAELESAFAKIKKQGLRLEAIFTHHRSADELSSEWFWQNENFKRVKKVANELAEKFGFQPLKFHSSNSASLLRTENFSEDMARVGIGVYGCIELPKALHVEGFKPVLSLYAEKISSRKLKRGAMVGYGATYRAQKEMVVSTYDVGYGDGFLRVLSNCYKTPEGIEVLGRISMDNATFLSSSEVLLIFDDARTIAKDAGTISYEILTSLKANIRRKILG